MGRLAALLRNRKGATAIEYGLIAMFIAVALVASFQTIGGQVMGFYDSANDGFGGAGS